MTFASALASPASQAGPAAGAGRVAGAGAVAGTGWAAQLPERAQQWLPAMESAAAAAGIDVRLLASLVKQESAFRADARSHAGAIGLGQLMPGTARELGVDPHDPQQNLNGAARYLRSQLDRFGSVELALAAYNAGPGRVARAGGIPQITETRNYVATVTRTYDTLRST
jgi:soluble lytic murein transglycosylase-like protein